MPARPTWESIHTRQTPLCTESPRSSSPGRAYLQALPVDKHLSDRFTPQVDVFNLLGCYVLSLCQFEYVLFPVNNLQGTILFIRGQGCEALPGWFPPHTKHTQHRALYTWLVFSPRSTSQGLSPILQREKLLKSLTHPRLLSQQKEQRDAGASAQWAALCRPPSAQQLPFVSGPK